MLNKTKTLYSGLSNLGKISLWAAIGVVIFGSMITSAAPNDQSYLHQPSDKIAADGQESREEKKLENMHVEISFDKTEIKDNNLESGKTILRTAGENGLKVVTYEVIYIDGKEIDRRSVKEEIIKEPTTQLIAIGTYIAPAPQPTPRSQPESNCDPNYTPCIPNVRYDLDCTDIDVTVTVIGTDRHRLDRDKDGLGCE